VSIAFLNDRHMEQTFLVSLLVQDAW